MVCIVIKCLNDVCYYYGDKGIIYNHSKEINMNLFIPNFAHMYYVLVSVLCSVTVSVLLKLARGRGLDVRQIIVWNYPVAAGLTYYFFSPQLTTIFNGDVPWTTYSLLALLLPSVFFALGESLRHTGLVRTEIAQRLSLVIPLCAAFFLFGERANVGTIVGLSIGLVAIICSIGWGRGVKGSKNGIYAILVFLGYGLCDVLFKSIAQITAIPYTTSMFIVFLLAMLVAFTYLVGYAWLSKQKINRASILWGLVLGGFNFANILFYMKAHRALPDNPSIVFTGMNIGVISIGALVGVLFFREKLSAINKVGLGLSLVAIIILASFAL